MIIVRFQNFVYRIISCKTTLCMSFHAYFSRYASLESWLPPHVRLLLHLGYNLTTEKHDILFIKKLKFRLADSILIDWRTKWNKMNKLS